MAVTPRFSWIAVSAGVAVMAVASVAWLQLPESDPPKDTAAPLPALGLTRLDPGASRMLLAEKLAAYDPAPLFIPSPMSSNEPPLPEEARSGVSSPFDGIAPEFTKTGVVKFALPLLIPASPVEGLRLTERTDAPLAVARGDAAPEPLPARVGQVEVVDSTSGNVVLVLDLGLSGALPEGDWQPLEMIGAINRQGFVGGLVITTSSGSSETDEYFRYHLIKNLRIGERLPEGFYAFRVGP